jgi:threonine/homoserine/homoserine lactone efflux protein
MTALLPPWPLFLAFMAASLVLAVTPGPAVIYIVTRSALHGRRHGIASVAGVAVGNLVNAWAAAVGLAALFAISAAAFTIVKIAGAAYLVWLGCRMLLAAAPAADTAAPVSAPLRRIFREGVVVAALNPKTAMFFAAFMPQFISAPEHALGQSLALGLIFVVVAGFSDCLYALAAGWLAPRVAGGLLHRSQRAAGGILIGLGIFTALTGPRHR